MSTFSIDRIVTIIAFMYGNKAEVVISIPTGESWLYMGRGIQNTKLEYSEVLCLIDTGIIELDGGSNEKGNETEVYALTSQSREKMREIIKNKTANTR